MIFRVYNKRLDPNLWDKEKKLNPEVRSTLLQIAKDYYMDTDELTDGLTDIYLVGSSANYNWSPDSDLDMHLVVDAEKLELDRDTARTIFELLSYKWNFNHNIIVKGHKVELYIQNLDHPIKSSGVYSIIDDEWVKEPHPEKVDIDEEDIKTKFRIITKRIDRVVKEEDVDKMKKVMEDIRRLRKTGLDKSGELSAENIVFKMLRKFKYIEKLKDATRQFYDREMTLTEKLKDKSDLIIGYVTPLLQVMSKTRAEIKGHGGFGRVNWIVNKAWRFRKDLNLLFWWDPPSGEITQDEKDAVHDYLEKKYGAKNIKEKILVIRNDESGDQTYNLAHGIEEMANLYLKGKTAYAGDAPLKGMELEKIENNIVVFRQPNPGDFIPEGFTLLYFLDSDENAEQMRQGKIPYLTVPRGTFHSGGSPITDIWKKKFQRPGTEHIIGHVEANTDPEEIFLDMITVRPGWKRNRIATLMVDALKKMYPGAKITHSSATQQGEKLLKSLNISELETNTISEADSRNVDGKYFHVTFDDPPPNWRPSDKIGIIYFGKGDKKIHFANTFKEELMPKKLGQWVINRHDGAFDMDFENEGIFFDDLKDLIAYLDDWYEKKSKDTLKESLNEWWITGITSENLESVSEKYSGNINNVTHRMLSFKYHFPGAVLFWRYSNRDNSLNFWATPKEEMKREVLGHLSNLYGIKPEKIKTFSMNESSLLMESPDQKKLKQNRKPLSDEERAEVMKRGAVWHHGPNGEATPAVWKAVVDGKTWYCCNTHRAIQIKPTLKGAIKAFDFIKTTA